VKPELTIDLAYEALQGFFREKPLVVFGTGPSCALDRRFGMNALQAHLLTAVPKEKLTKNQQDQWPSVARALDSGRDLETAMNEVTDLALVSQITRITADFVGGVDQEHSWKILKGQEEWPAGKLFEKLVSGLPETDRALHVVTPNYDLLAEYAWERLKIPYINGFVGGVCRHLRWEQSIRQLLHPQRTVTGRRMHLVSKPLKHIRLHKVHGSLNTFLIQNEIVENNAWLWAPNPPVERFMITPGMSKYEKIAKRREVLLAPADRAIRSERQFLFIGYGFNDDHLEVQIRQKLRMDKCPGLIITRDLNARIQDLSTHADNLWVVCKRGDAPGSQIFNNQYRAWLPLPDKDLWDIQTFATELLGG